MNVALVETFLAVVAARSFRRASVRLVERRASGALPTPDAGRFLPYAESLVTRGQSARAGPGRLSGRQLGRRRPK